MIFPPQSLLVVNCVQASREVLIVDGSNSRRGRFHQPQRAALDVHEGGLVSQRLLAEPQATGADNEVIGLKGGELFGTQLRSGITKGKPSCFPSDEQD